MHQAIHVLAGISLVNLDHCQALVEHLGERGRPIRQRLVTTSLMVCRREEVEMIVVRWAGVQSSTSFSTRCGEVVCSWKEGGEGRDEGGEGRDGGGGSKMGVQDDGGCGRGRGEEERDQL